MPVYYSDQYTSDFSPYLRHIFAVKHIYLTLYIVCMCSAAPICSVPPALAAAWPCSPRPCSLPCAPVPVCACVCVWPSYLRPDCLSARLRPCLPAPTPACSHACLRTCAHARMRGLLAPVVRAYIVASPAVLLLAVLLSPPAANFFEIVF